MSYYNRFELTQSDGVHCSQVLVYDDDDLQYWKEQAAITGHLIALDKHVPADFFGWSDPAHDIYQIFPPEMKERFKDVQIVDTSVIM